MEDISKSVKKVDSLIKMSGKAQYVDDIKIDGMLYAKTVRSTKSKANIIRITLPELPKGYYKVDYRDIPGKNVVSIIFDDMPVFAEKTVTYYGEPIMLIVGEDKNVITDIISKPTSCAICMCFERGSLLIRYGLLPLISFQVKSENDQCPFHSSDKP